MEQKTITFGEDDQRTTKKFHVSPPKSRKISTIRQSIQDSIGNDTVNGGDPMVIKSISGATPISSVVKKPPDI